MLNRRVFIGALGAVVPVAANAPGLAPKPAPVAILEGELVSTKNCGTVFSGTSGIRLNLTEEGDVRFAVDNAVRKLMRAGRKHGIRKARLLLILSDTES
jgi:hypothetical protein